jgi:hypothetical protein
MSDPQADNQILIDRMKGMIEKHGWFAQYVGAGSNASRSLRWNPELPGPAQVPGFTYTVGLSGDACHHPELIVVGPGYATGYGILKAVHEEISNGRRFAPGDLLTTEVPGVPLLVVEVEDSRQQLLVANMFARMSGVSGPVPALQLVLPDEDGRWPWQEGSNMRAIPLLGRIPEVGAVIRRGSPSRLLDSPT